MRNLLRACKSVYQVRLVAISASMAKSKFEYVRKFEQNDSCLPNTWMVVRLDGKCFHRFADVHDFKKPNDDRSLSLMTHSAKCVMKEFPDIILAYGQSDEYSFVLKKDTTLYGRRSSKLISVISSYFASSFVFHWTQFFPSSPLLYPPSFDGRVVLYPSITNLRDYLSWRQADCHINNLYNTCFWALVHSGVSNTGAVEMLKGTVASDKNELLFSKFGINYNNLPQLYRKGTTLIWGTDKEVAKVEELAEPDLAATHSHTSPVQESIVEVGEEGGGGGGGGGESGAEGVGSETKSKGAQGADTNMRRRRSVMALHTDIIGDAFWEAHPHLLGGRDC